MRIKKFFSVSLSLITVILLLISISFIIPVVMGFKPYAVVSGSMEPKYHVGSIVFAKKMKPTDIKEGDCITFRLGDTTATHRVADIDPEKMLFVTKGDANKIEDDPIPFSSLIGRTSDFTIPLLGYVAVFLKTMWGKITVIAIITVLVIIAIARTIIIKSKKEGQITAP